MVGSVATIQGWLINNSTLTLTSTWYPFLSEALSRNRFVHFRLRDYMSYARFAILHRLHYQQTYAACDRIEESRTQVITDECHDNDMKDKSVYRKGRAHARSKQLAQYISSSDLMAQI